MKKQQISVSYNHEKRTLVVSQNGKPVGGFVGARATEIMKKIAYNNTKVEVKDGNVQVGVQ